ncbi:hypothetical protein GEMRC1_011702 [Eukaryota sp. GEM-RC1]
MAHPQPALKKSRSTDGDTSHLYSSPQPISSTKKRSKKPSQPVTNDRPVSTLQESMQRKIDGARFRQINELLYTNSSDSSLKLFTNEPDLGDLYHKGFEEQVKSWPVNPVDKLIEKLSHLSETSVLVDMGCGNARIAESISCTVHSFDIHPLNPTVVRADISNVPLSSGVADVVVFCLSLMGSNIIDFITEASRILKVNGILHIAEVTSRFNDLGDFNTGMRQLGFNSKKTDRTNTHFIMLEYRKARDIDEKRKARAAKLIELKPCIYKKR